ncbi:MAG: hypothetical protein V3S83_12450 [Gemmatimonadota bacterium]
MIWLPHITFPGDAIPELALKRQRWRLTVACLRARRDWLWAAVPYVYKGYEDSLTARLCFWWKGIARLPGGQNH